MSRRSLVRLGVLALLWGSGFLFVKVALGGLSPFQIVFGRLVMGSLAMLGLTSFGKHALPRDHRTWFHLGIMAIITNIAPYFLFAWAELRVSSGLAGVLNATTPLFTLLIALATGVERPGLSRLTGLVVGLGGVVVLAAPWSSGQPSSQAGILAGLVASACYALGYVYARRFLTPRRLPALVLSTGQAIAGTVLLVIATPVVGLTPVHVTVGIIGAVLTLGIAGTGVAYVVNYQLIADEGATAASVAIYLIPVVALLLGVVFLAEPVTRNVVLGAATILAGVALSEGRLTRRIDPHRITQPASS